MRITTFGAAECVTGSKHLLEVNGNKILFDCGLVQGKRIEAAHANQRLPFDVNSLNAVVLSHAHIDHSGTLPMLIKHGYQGRIFSTPATRDLCAVMLIDSAHIQERDAKWLSKKQLTFVPPIYTEDHARTTLRHFMTTSYGFPFDVAPGVRVTFRDAGHVLGSAMCQVDIEEGTRRRRFIYSGDIGRKNMPILQDPWEPDDADIVMMESTYGDRDHDPMETLDDKLSAVITRTYERGGKVVVPSFALERSQEFIYALKRLESQKRIPDMPVYVDSPLTVNITEVFRLHTELFDSEMQQILESAGDPFQLKHIRYIRSLEESMELNERHEPMIIISAAGMCEYGRILHHLRNNCEDARNTILIIGFQAQNTLGRRIVEREREIKIFGIKHPLRAEVKTLNSLSAHAGRTELIAFGKRFKDRAEKVLLVHGEDTALEALRGGLVEQGCNNIAIQRPETPVEF